MKIAEIKDKYKQKISKKCYYCNNDLEISMNLNTTLDQINMTQFNDSFLNKSQNYIVYDDFDSIEGIND